jgi:hypothetical protein
MTTRRRLFNNLLWMTVLVAAIVPNRADSNINSNQALGWSANIGLINCRPGKANDLQVDEFVCSGHIYSANIGWISLGSGHPENGIQYQNNSASDFGVNLDSQGNLRGLAYGANVGWINFETNGAPRIDLRNGQFSGFAYSANVGWINLGGSGFSLKVDSIAPGLDSDNDGIPDAWELIHAGNLTTFNADSDADRDRCSDLQEYLADTDPLDPNDNLRIIQFSPSKDRQTSLITWTAKPTRLYSLESRVDLGKQTVWTESSLGLMTNQSASLSLTLSNRLDSVQYYYRVQAYRPLAPPAP